MTDNYIYPARITNEAGMVKLELVDFEGAMAEAESISDAVTQAQEVLALHLIDLLDAGRELPEPSDMSDCIYVHVWLPYYRNMTKVIYVKKTVTIPQWLDTLAKSGNVNFSACLVRGIKEELGINQ